MRAVGSADSQWRCGADAEARTVHIPFPSARHAAIALRALSVDKELSPLVRRAFSLTPPSSPDAVNGNGSGAGNGAGYGARDDDEDVERRTVLKVEYSATTPRMLRVATNGFFESLGVIVGTMEELDEDVVGLPGKESVAGAQGIETLEGEG